MELASSVFILAGVAYFLIRLEIRDFRRERLFEHNRRTTAISQLMRERRALLEHCYLEAVDKLDKVLDMNFRIVKYVPKPANLWQIFRRGRWHEVLSDLSAKEFEAHDQYQAIKPNLGLIDLDDEED